MVPPAVLVSLVRTVTMNIHMHTFVSIVRHIDMYGYYMYMLCYEYKFVNAFNFFSYSSVSFLQLLFQIKPLTISNYLSIWSSFYILNAFYILRSILKQKRSLFPWIRWRTVWKILSLLRCPWVEQSHQWYKVFKIRC